MSGEVAGMIIGAVGVVVAAASLIVAVVAVKRANAANTISQGANILAVAANTLAVAANSLAEEGNRLAQTDTDAAHHDVNWHQFIWAGHLRFRNTSDGVAARTVHIDAWVDDERIKSEPRDVEPRGEFEIEFPRARERSRQEINQRDELEERLERLRAADPWMSGPTPEVEQVELDIARLKLAAGLHWLHGTIYWETERGLARRQVFDVIGRLHVFDQSFRLH